MEEFTTVITGNDGEVAERLALDFGRRERARQRTTLDTGETIGIRLPRGTVLRGGDVIASASGRHISVTAAPEPVSMVTLERPAELARIAYHLGNRHVRVQVGNGWLRYQRDHVLDDMVRGLGCAPRHESAPFEPEAGAYHGHGHDHEH